MRSVLISGAGIAGSTAAYWLAKAGFEVTVVERARGMRSSGAPVDVHGPAFEVAERMGVTARLQAADTGVRSMVFVDARGRIDGRMDMRRVWFEADHVELPRGDLAAILRDAVPDDVEVLFGTSITALAHDADGVSVRLDDGPDRRFDLVVGADGVHSGVRALAFGPEALFTKHLGIYVATMPVDGFDAGQDVVMYNMPGRSVTIHPARGRALAAFMFRAPALAHFDHRDIEQHKRLLIAAYAGAGWRVPELLDRVRVADDLYFDSVSRVHVPEWSCGRVTLVGDAAACVSLFGDGSSLAMAGAFTLAESLYGDLAAGLRDYEARHRPLTDSKERGVRLATSLFVPATAIGIRVRNLATRVWPLVAGGQRLLSRA